MSERSELLQKAAAIGLATQPDETVQYYDIRAHLDLGDREPKLLKVVGVPFPYAALLPASWEAQDSDHSPEKLLKLEAVAVENEKAVDLRSAGDGEPEEIYESAMDRLRASVRKGKLREGKLDPYEGDKLAATPVKLLLYLARYRSDAVQDAEYKDRIELIIDKLSLLTFAPILLDNDKLTDWLGDEASTLPDVDKRISATLNAIDLRQISDDELLNPHPDFKLKISPSEWDEIFAAGKAWQGEEQLFIPLDELEMVCRDNLESIFADLSGGNTEEIWKGYETRVTASNSSANAPKVHRRADYGFFYPLIDRYMNKALSESATDMNVYKMTYRDALPEMPTFEQIEARAPLWAAELNALSAEYTLARQRLQAALSLLQPPKDESGTAAPEYVDTERLEDDVRDANARLFEVRRRVEILKDEVSESGYKVVIPKLESDKPADFGLKQETRILQTISTRRQILSTWYVRVRKRIRIGLFRKITIRRWVQRRRWRWYSVTRTRVRITTDNINIEWRPIQNYLQQKVPIASYADERSNTNTADDPRLIRLRGLLGLASDAVVTNGDKELHVFELTDSGYRDQQGVSVERVLAGADDPSTRARLLLLFPLHERRADGETALVGFRAVHNPVAPRRTYSQPNVFLVESYSHSLRQKPGHFLGALSHIVSLFPGERRVLTLETKSRLEQEQVQNQSSRRFDNVERKVNIRQQVRQDVERTREDGKKTRWNVKASGGVNLGFAKFGGGGGGGGESYKSKKSVSKDINDRVSESLQKSSQENEVQFSTSSTMRSSRSQTNSQTIEIENVNKGRVLNFKYFQVQSKFASAVRIEGIKIVVEYDEEIVPGVDIAHTTVVGLDELDGIFPELTEENRRRTIEAIRAMLQQRAEAVGYDLDKLAAGTLQSLDERSWVVNSGSYFVDSEVGPSTATEPYVEEARNAEVAERQAVSERISAEAKAIEQGKTVLPSQVRELRLTMPDTDV